MASFFITGVAGFLGSHLARALLDAGHRVSGVDDLDPYYDPARKRRNLQQLAGDAFQADELDIRDGRLPIRIADAAPDAIVHLAALAGVRPSLTDPARYVAVNVDGTRAVLDAAMATGTRRVVFASSSSVYGTDRPVPFLETDAADRPISPYAATKRAGELLCHADASAFGLSIAIVRPFTGYGPRQRPDLAIHRFMTGIAAGDPVTMYGDGTTSRDYTAAADLTQGMVAALDWTEHAAPGACRIFNLGSGRAVPLVQLIDAVARVVDRPARIDHAPEQPGDVTHTLADLTRSRSELGYEPRWTLEEGLRAQWTWMQEEAGDRPSI